MPPFCRHNRLEANCPICRPPEAPPEAKRAPRSRSGTATKPRAGRGGASSELRISRPARLTDDGYRNELVPGVKNRADAHRLAVELTRATERLKALENDPPGLYRDVAGEPDLEEATWLAFLIAYLAPLEDEDDPFAEIARVRTTWASGEPPDLDGVRTGPRTAHDADRDTEALTAYRAWVERAGSQAQAFTGELAWSAERRFERVFERLSLPGFHRGARYELLVTLGRLGRYDLRAPDLRLAGDPGDPVTEAAKRVFGIADANLIERRARDLADAAQVPIEALDVSLFSWGRDQPRSTDDGEAVAPDHAAALGI